jgi:hypothetical protein
MSLHDANFQSTADNSILRFNADTLEEIPSMPLYKQFSEGQYDQELNQIIGIWMVTDEFIINDY